MILLALAAAAAVASADPNAPTLSDATPPPRFQGDSTVTLQFTDQQGINSACNPKFGTPPAGMKTNACEFKNHIVAPNPCSFPDEDYYAHLLCHELGHANGWPPAHGE